jgi:HK97 family phage major capsid protein
VSFDNIISRADADALIPIQEANEILTLATQQSAAMGLFRRINMSAKQFRMPVLAALPVAYFVNGDTGLKQTTEVNWEHKYLDAEEIACIVPIPENVLDDSRFPIWANVRPLVAEAVGRTLDAAIFFGSNKPASWPAAIVPTAIARGKVVTRGTANAAAGGIAGDFSNLFALVEQSGFDVSGLVLSRIYRGLLRNARNTQGNLFPEVSPGDVYGIDPRYTLRGMWPVGANSAEGVAGDFSFAILGLRSDIAFKVLDQAVISDADGKIIYNLPQQDMLALRVTARFAWQVGDPISHDEPDPDKRYPFGVIRGTGLPSGLSNGNGNGDGEPEAAEAEDEPKAARRR